MADSSFGSHRVFVVNGQPLIISGDNRIDSVNSINANILQQALQNASTHDSITVIDSNCSNFLSKDVTLDETTDDKEYVAILGDNENDEAPTIHLTLEQAAELGLQFEVDNCDQSTVSVEKVSSANFVLPNQNKLFFDERNSQSVINQITGSSKLNVNSFIQQTNNLSTQSQVNSDQPQQVTLIPQFINGTMTYSMQLSSNPNNDFIQLKTPAYSLQSNEPCNILSTTPSVTSTDFNAEGNLSTSIMSFIQPTLSTSQVGLLSTNCIEPIMSTGISSKINATNHSTKLAYILPHSDLDSEIVETSSNYSSPPHVVEPIKRPRILSNGISKQTSIRKTVALPTKSLLNKSNQSNSSVKTTLLKESVQTTSNSTVNAVTKISEACRSNSKSTPQQKINEINFSNPSSSSLEARNENTSNEKTVAKSKTESENNSNKVLKTIDSRVVTSLPQDVSATFSRTPIKSDSKKPLGSNKNPIQLVQQGQTFHSMHTLTQDHIKKVITVLQQKDIDTAYPSKNVLYDAESNTRIIYRVVCPEELYLKKKTEDSVPVRKRGRPKRIRLSLDNQSNEVVGSEGTGEEEQPRKKCSFSRTRSGRLSRPPKHMVRDYKRIMKLDGEESDGAYSDYHSDHEEESVTSANLLPGLSMKQKRNISSQFHCPTCGKIYLGFVRMSRHFDKYPDHGSPEYLKMLRNSHPEEFNGGGNGIWRGGKRRAKTKSRVVYPNNFSEDKCNKLRESLEACEGQEIAAIAGPAVAKLLTTWELILLRVEAVGKENRVAALYRELKQLLKKITQIAGKVFKPLDHEVSLVDKGFTVEVEDELMSKVLEIPCGVYQVSDEELYHPQPGIINNDEVESNNGFNVENTKSLVYKQESLDVSDYAQSDSDEEFREKNVEKTHKFTEDEDSQVLSALNIMDKNVSQSRKEQSRVTESYLLPNEEIMCVPDERDLDSVDEIVSERLQNLTGTQHQDLCKTDVDELMKGFSVLDHRIVNDAVRNESQDDLMEGFSIASRRPHAVSASTEDLIKSLEHFGSELNNSDERTGFSSSTLDRENFTRVTNVELDFEVLSREFHSNNR